MNNKDASRSRLRQVLDSRNPSTRRFHLVYISRRLAAPRHANYPLPFAGVVGPSPDDMSMA